MSTFMHRVIYTDNNKIANRYGGSNKIDRTGSDVSVTVSQEEILRVLRELRPEDRVGDKYLISGGMVEKVTLDNGKSLLVHLSAGIMGSLDFEIRYDLHKYRYAKNINNPLIK